LFDNVSVFLQVIYNLKAINGIT